MMQSDSPFLHWIRSASRRNRLDGTTFKFLNTGSFLSFSYLALTQFAGIPAALTPCKLMLVCAALFGSLTTGSVVLKYGLPRITFKGANILSCSYMLCSILTMINSVDVSAQSILQRSATMSRAVGNPFDAFLVSSIFLALAGAASAGSKRLSSDTYKQLNLCVIATVIGKLIWFWMSGMQVFSKPKLALAVMAALSAFTGFYRGEMFHKNRSRLANSFSI